MAAATLDHSALNAQVVGCRRWTKVLSSIPNSLTCTCLPLYLLVPRARSCYSVSLFIVFRGGFASVRPHSRADHSLGQEPVYLYTPTMRACKDLKFTRAAQCGKCKMYGESETTDYSVKSHSLWPKTPHLKTSASQYL